MNNEISWNEIQEIGCIHKAILDCCERHQLPLPPDDFGVTITFVRATKTHKLSNVQWMNDGTPYTIGISIPFTHPQTNAEPTHTIHP